MRIANSSKAVTGTSLLAGILLLAYCTKDDHGNPHNPPNKQIEWKDHSSTPAFIKKLSGFENVGVYTLISSDDTLPQSPQYIFGGSADGAGLVKQGDNYVMLVNQEDNYSVSRITLDKTFKPVKGEYLLNSDGGQWRLCSATMATPAEHGFGPLYLTCGESNVEGNVHGLDPLAPAGNPSVGHELKALGYRSAENAVPLPKKTYPGKTAIVIGEDADDASGGQVFLYLANSTGDLQNGNQYMLRRTDGNQRETDMTAGATYDVEFAQYDKTLTGKEVADLTDQLKAIKFGRVEDVDYRKGSADNGREIYFTVTGQDKSGVNADASRTMYGRVYRLRLDANNPLKGKLEVILDGDDNKGIATAFQNPDNICATENYVYIQEDSNGYGTEDHDAYVYQYTISSKQLKPVFELNHFRDTPNGTRYGGTGSKFGSWEYGALVDISDVIGVPDAFTLCIQPHTWRGDRYKGADGGAKRSSENQASEVVYIKGLPR
jgi:hypothetical protein